MCRCVRMWQDAVMVIPTRLALLAVPELYQLLEINERYREERRTALCSSR